MITTRPKGILVLREKHTAYSQDVIQGIQDTAMSRHGWWASVPAFSQIAGSISKARRNEFDGVVAIAETPAFAEMVASVGGVTVNASVFQSIYNAVWLRTDLMQVCRMAVERLKQQNVKTITSIHHRPHCLVGQFDAAMEFACQAAGLRFAPGYCVQLTSASQRGIRDWFLNLPQDLGVVTANDLAFSRWQSMMAYERNVLPGNLHFVRMTDSLPEAKCATVETSMIRHDAVAIGKRAVDLLASLFLLGDVTDEDKIVAPMPIESAGQGLRQTPMGQLEEVLAFIRKSACDGITVEDVAQLTHCSRRTLERNFRALRGCSISQEISQVRMEYAKHLLRTTGLSVRDVGIRAGFNSAEYFSTSFRRENGCTPSAFRKMKYGSATN